MNLNLLVSIFLITSSVYSQSFQGEYTSHKTSFKDEINSENSFIEETDFNIIIVSKTDEMEGVIIIHDPRIPEQNLIYSVLEYIGELTNRQIKSYNFKCRPEHTNEDESIITLYFNEKKNLSLMVSNAESSQVFFDLKSVK